LRALVEKVHRHAYKITDEEIAALKQNYSDDQLFELIVAAAVGAAGQRLDAALSALSALEEAGP
jgi:alkylhydroperoxidase family enzyme